jgi:rubrerythrin
LRDGKLTGQTRQFAEVVGREEREHLHYLERTLGRAAGSAPAFKFGDATTDNAKFIAAAVEIEDTGLAAYNGQAENMSRATLGSVARVISVEARHAAWARSLAGKLPAPVPADVPITASAALKSIKPYLG